jgi:hypothetical protein
MAITTKRVRQSKQAIAVSKASQRGDGVSLDRSDNNGGTLRLASFFPDALPMHVPARLYREELASTGIPVVIEYGTPREVILSCEAVLEFGESVRLTSRRCSLAANARVIAVQFGGSEPAFAVRFTAGAENWIIKE